MQQLIINLISGLLAGNAVGGVSSKLNMGPVLNSIAGLAGGWLGGTGLSAITNIAGNADMGGIISSIAGGAGGGAILTSLAGLIRNRLSGSKK